MPEIVRLSNCKICIYPGDHAPPHLHVRGAGWAVSISLFEFELMQGKGPRTDILEAIEWARQPGNSLLLMSEWVRLNERD
jgi:hypothetical protein